jgi:diaminohydroxyphosphoribosylaminopyrimidine deaminase/5-amino-6-(5-phosphoribosylamino)uracil reductase
MLDPDVAWMRAACAEAEKGVGLTAPNPPVGAVVVSGAGDCLGRAWHRRAGGAHAEREALDAAVAVHGVDQVRGATVYITLEPCSTHGRTPPCTARLLDAGVSRVVYGSTDPNPAHAGRARALLEQAGIVVITGVEEARCDELIRPFAKVQRCGLPWVILKTAMSLDGRITRPPGEGQWLSSAAARESVHALRQQVEVILTSGETLRRDNPRLTLRGPCVCPEKIQPLRAVLTMDAASLPSGATVFTDAHAERTRVYENPDLPALLASFVSDHHALTVLIEAGGRLAARFLEADLVDEVHAYLTPWLTAGSVPAVAGRGAAATDTALRLEDPTYQRLGPDVLLRARVAGRGAPSRR